MARKIDTSSAEITPFITETAIDGWIDVCDIKDFDELKDSLHNYMAEHPRVKTITMKCTRKE